MRHADGLDLIERDIRRQAAELRRAAPGLRDAARRLAVQVPGPPRVYLIGCGDSLDGATAARYAWGSVVATPVDAVPAMTFSTRIVDLAPPGSLVVALSQSGKVSRVIEAVRAARARGLRTVTITSNPASPLASEPSDAAWLLELEKLGPVPGMTSHLLGAAALAELGAAYGTDERADRLRADLDRLPELVEAATEIAWPVARAHADRFDRDHFVLALGYGPVLGTARFTVRRILELAQLVAISQETEEYGHDEYSLVDRRFRVMMFAPPDRGLARSMEVARYLRRLEVVLGIVGEAGTMDGLDRDDVAYGLPDVPPSLNALVYAVPGQVLSLEIARRAGGSLYGSADRVHAEDGDPQIYASAISVT
jgi:fructoselysine-6-P-deglycase FrlB-like protein